MMNSTQVIEKLAQKLNGDAYKEQMILEACESLASGFLSLRNLGFTKSEILEILEKETRL